MVTRYAELSSLSDALARHDAALVRIELSLDVLVESFLVSHGAASADAARLAALIAKLKESQGDLAKAVETATEPPPK